MGFLLHGPVVGFRSEQACFVTSDGFAHPLSANGFRWDECIEPESVRVVTIGCSFAFGYGLDAHDTWSGNFCRLLSEATQHHVTDINLSMPGGSNDYILRQALSSVPVLRPSVLLVAFTQSSRREHWAGADKTYTVRPGSPRSSEWGEHRIELQGLIERTSDIFGPWQDASRLQVAIRCCRELCRAEGVRFLYTYATVRNEPTGHGEGDSEAYLGAVFPRIDFSGDQKHPGPLSNQLLAIRTFLKWTELEREVASTDTAESAQRNRSDRPEEIDWAPVTAPYSAVSKSAL